MRRRKGRLAKILSVPVLAACGFAVAATLAGVGLAGVSTSTSSTPTPTTSPTTPTTTSTTTPRGNKGCTPGFWKNNADKKDAVQWVPTGFSPDQSVESVFSAVPSDIANLTLLEGLQLGGSDEGADGVGALTRHGIAAVLNAAHPDIAYPLTVGEIVTAVNAAFATGDKAEMLAVKDVLAGFNKAGCPISQNP